MMTLTKGDHLLIKRNGQVIVSEEAESYHEFEVVSDVEYRGTDENGKVLYEVTLAVIK